MPAGSACAAEALEELDEEVAEAVVALVLDDVLLEGVVLEGVVLATGCGELEGVELVGVLEPLEWWEPEFGF